MRRRNNVAVEPFALFRRPVDERRRIGNLAAGFRQRLALLPRHQQCQLVGSSQHQIRQAPEWFASLGCREAAPAIQRPVRRLDGGAGFCGSAVRNVGNQFICCRIGYGRFTSGNGPYPLPIYQITSLNKFSRKHIHKDECDYVQLAFAIGYTFRLKLWPPFYRGHGSNEREMLRHSSRPERHRPAPRIAASRSDALGDATLALFDAKKTEPGRCLHPCRQCWRREAARPTRPTRPTRAVQGEKGEPASAKYVQLAQLSASSGVRARSMLSDQGRKLANLLESAREADSRAFWASGVHP